MDRRNISDNLKQLGNIKRDDKRKRETFQKIKLTIDKKNHPIKLYVATTLASLLLIILLLPMFGQDLSLGSKDAVTLEKVIEKNLIETVHYSAADFNEQTFNSIKEEFVNSSQETDFPFESMFTPTEYTLIYSNGDQAKYHVWMKAIRTANGIEFTGVYQPVGEEPYYLLSDQVINILMNDLYKYNLAEEKNNLKSWYNLNLDVEQNNLILDNPSFIENALEGKVENIKPPLNTSGQSLIKNYMGLPDYKSDPAEGLVWLVYEDCRCGFGVEYGYEENPALGIVQYLIPINMSRDMIISKIGEPDAEGYSETGSGYYLYYYDDHGRVYLKFGSNEEDVDTFSSLYIN
ncbi:hypothetical protein ACLIA0_06735 [Bacillaceae bacterium W0354]